MKKLIALLLVITTVFACFGCESAHHTPKGTAEKLLNNLISGDGYGFCDCYISMDVDIIDKYIEDDEEKLELKQNAVYSKSTLLSLISAAGSPDLSYKITGIGIYGDDDTEFYYILDKFFYKNTEIVYAVDQVSEVTYSMYRAGVYFETNVLYFYRIGDFWYEGTNAIIAEYYPGIFPEYY